MFSFIILNIIFTVLLNYYINKLELLLMAIIHILTVYLIKKPLFIGFYIL